MSFSSGTDCFDSNLLGYPNWQRLDLGLRPRCEEEIEHALLCPSVLVQYARGSFPETLDLKSAWYDATTNVRRTSTAYPPGFTPSPKTVAPLPNPPLLPRCPFAWVRRFLRLPSLFIQPVMFPSGLPPGSPSVLSWCSNVLFRFHNP